MKIKQDGAYTSFVLDDNSDFYLTGYRILKKQENDGILPCWKVLLNGKIKLIYPIGERLLLTWAAKSWKSGEVQQYIGQVLSIICRLADTGFLSPEAVWPDVDHMYMDKSSGKVFLTVLPVIVKTDPQKHLDWLMALKKALLNLMEISPGKRDSQFREQTACIRRALSLNELIEGFNTSKASEDFSENSGMEDESFVESRRLCLVLQHSPRNFSIEITKDEFTIGKLKNSVDGWIDFTPTVSRLHCKITKRNGRFYIQDLGSANHTYVNGVMAVHMEPVEIKVNDNIRLAELDFKVQWS